MGLAEIQAALAQLYTNAGARAEMRNDHRQFAERHGLSTDEAQQLAESILDEADSFARSLERKRFSEAAKAMPSVRTMLGARMGELFAHYAAATPLGTQRNPALDGLSFIRWLLHFDDTELSRRDKEALRYEESRILMQQSRRLLLVRWVRPPGRASSLRSIAIWWRWRGRLRHWVSR